MIDVPANDPAFEIVLSGWPTGLAAVLGYRLLRLDAGGADLRGRVDGVFAERPTGSGTYVLAFDSTGLTPGDILQIAVDDGTTTKSAEMRITGPAASIASQPYVGYPPASALVAGAAPELRDATAAGQETYRRLAIKAVEGYTGQHFEPSYHDASAPLILDGPGGGELYLPKRAETLTAVFIKGLDVDLTDVTLSAKGDRLSFAALSQDYAVVAMRETAYDTRTFRRGAGTVTLHGTFGWSAVPEDIVLALREEMTELARADGSGLAGSVSAFRRLGIRQTMQGNLNLSIGDPSAISPKAATLAADYIWPAAGVLV